MFFTQRFSSAFMSRTGIIFFFFLLRSVSLFAQNEGVVFSSRELTIGKAIKEIEQQTSYVFAFNNAALNTDLVVKLTENTMTLATALKEVLKDSGFTYILRGRFIAVTPDDIIPQRANPVARTRDAYSKTDPGLLNNLLSGVLPQETKGNEAPALLIGAQVSDKLLESYSDYAPLNRYAHIQGALPGWAIKTNLLYGLSTLTPNVAVEIGLKKNISLEIAGSYNWYNRKGTMEDNKKLVHYTIRPELRYWLCERFTGHFIGFHALYTKFNISEYSIPFTKMKKDFRHEGNAWGGGFSYGYHLPLSKSWNVEFNVGLGLAWLDYEKFDCTRCTRPNSKETDFYFGPTRAGITLVYLIK